jgi:hypothetical protein
MKKELETTLISDLGCATAIVCEGILPIELIKEKNSPKVFFVFNQTPTVKKVVDSYWTGKHLSPSRAYFENLKMLKNRIYSIKENGE